MHPKHNLKNIILYTVLAGTFFYLGASGKGINQNLEKKLMSLLPKEKTIENNVQDEIKLLIRRNNNSYKKIDEEFYFGIDLDILKDKYIELKEWMKQKLPELKALVD